MHVMNSCCSPVNSEVTVTVIRHFIDHHSYFMHYLIYHQIVKEGRTVLMGYRNYVEVQLFDLYTFSLVE